MKLAFLLEQLREQDFFKKFINENPDAFLTAGFFILDLETNEHKYQVDYFLPKQNKIAVIEHPFREIKILEDEIKDSGMLDENIVVDIDNLVEKIEKAKKENKTQEKVTKIIAVLKDNQWNLTCLNNMLGMLRIKISSLTGKIEDFQKGSLADFMGMKKLK